MAVVAATATLSIKRRKTSDGDEDEEEEGVKDRTTRSSWLEPDAPPPRRILIVASSGCMGKSTLAKTVATATGGVHLEMDDLCWTHGWQRRPPEQEHGLGVPTRNVRLRQSVRLPQRFCGIRCRVGLAQ